MSKIPVKLLIASTVVALISSCSDIEVSEQEPQNLFYKIYGGYYEETFADMAICSNGNIKIIGSSGNYDDGKDLYYAEVDAYGSLLFENKNQFDSTFVIEGHDVYIASSDKELIAYSYRENDDSCKVLIVNTSQTKTDIDTLSFWLKTDLLKSIKIIQVADSIITSIAAMTDSDGDDNICLYETSFSGNTELKLKQKLLYNIDPKNGLFTTVSDNKTIYAAISVNESTTSEKNNIFVMAIRDNSMQWGFSYGTQNADEVNSQILINGNTLFVCATEVLTEIESNIGILEINSADGTEVSFRKIEEKGNETLVSATTNNKGNFVLVGNTNKEVGTTKLFFKEIAPDLSLITEKEFGYKNHSKAGKITYSANDNCYYFAGTLNSNESVDIVLFKLNENGEWIE